MQIQGTLLAQEGNKLTIAGSDGKVFFGYAGGECVVKPNLQYAFTVEEKMSKEDKPYKTITAIVGIDGVAIKMTKKAWGGKGNFGGGKYDSEGQARGNCRAVTTEYIVACIKKGTTPNIAQFVALLKESEGLMLTKKVETAAVTPVTPPVVQPAVVAPAVASPAVTPAVTPTVTPSVQPLI